MGAESGLLPGVQGRGRGSRSAPRLHMHRCMANLRTNIMDFRGVDSSIILILRGGIPRPIGNFPEHLSQAILVGIMLVGRLGMSEGRFAHRYIVKLGRRRNPCKFEEPEHSPLASCCPCKDCLAKAKRKPRFEAVSSKSGKESGWKGRHTVPSKRTTTLSGTGRGRTGGMRPVSRPSRVGRETRAPPYQ